jgi:hypothetical protein
MAFRDVAGPHFFRRLMSAMALDTKTTQLLDRALSKVDDQETRGTRLLDDAKRLWGRVQALMDMNLLPASSDTDPLQLACYAMQLPLREAKNLPAGKLGKSNVRDRAEQAAEMIVTMLGGKVDESLLDRTAQLLHELPQRNPILDEARLLSDAVNLDDFGIGGVLQQLIQLCRSGGGVTQVMDGLEKREQYGYWDARLKDSFHFEPVRQLARARLTHARQLAALLRQEMNEDRAT